MPKKSKANIIKTKTLFDHIKAITEKPYDPDYWNKLSDSDKKTFSTYMIHRFISMNYYWIDIANLFQQYSYNLKPEIVYKLYATALPKSRTFLRYIKGKKDHSYEPELISIMITHFEVSKKEIILYLNILYDWPSGIDDIKNLLSRYGKSEKEIKKLIKRK